MALIHRTIALYILHVCVHSVMVPIVSVFLNLLPSSGEGEGEGDGKKERE